MFADRAQHPELQVAFLTYLQHLCNFWSKTEKIAFPVVFGRSKLFQLRLN
jgi:hypothetical protein